DLALLKGGVAVKRLAVFRDGADPHDPPMLALQRFWVRIGWRPLFRRTLEIRELEFDDPKFHLDRLKDGSVAVLLPRPPPPDAPPPPPPVATPPDKRWNVVVDRAALTRGKATLVDHVADPPESVTLGIPSLDLNGFRLLNEKDSQPGHGVFQMEFGDGSLRIETSITTREEGYAAEAKIDLKNVPLDRANMHAPELGWSTFKARLDAAVTLHAEPRPTPTPAGTPGLPDRQTVVPRPPPPAGRGAAARTPPGPGPGPAPGAGRSPAGPRAGPRATRP